MCNCFFIFYKIVQLTSQHELGQPMKQQEAGFAHVNQAWASLPSATRETNFKPKSNIMPNINETHQRVLII